MIGDEDILPIKVAGGSISSKVATAIVRGVEENKRVELLTIGAAALNQAYKACIIARQILAVKGLDLTIKPRFEVLNFKDDASGKDIERTAIKSIVVVS